MSARSPVFPLAAALRLGRPSDIWFKPAPMALLVTEFARFQDPGELIGERLVDTHVGALAAFAVTDRRSGGRLEHALTTAEPAPERAAPPP